MPFLLWQQFTLSRQEFCVLIVKKGNFYLQVVNKLIECKHCQLIFKCHFQDVKHFGVLIIWSAFKGQDMVNLTVLCFYVFHNYDILILCFPCGWIDVCQKVFSEVFLQTSSLNQTKLPMNDEFQAYLRITSLSNFIPARYS